MPLLFLSLKELAMRAVLKEEMSFQDLPTRLRKELDKLSNFPGCYKLIETRSEKFTKTGGGAPTPEEINRIKSHSLYKFRPHSPPTLSISKASKTSAHLWFVKIPNTHFVRLYKRNMTQTFPSGNYCEEGTEIGDGDVTFKKAKFGGGGVDFSYVKFGDGVVSFWVTNFGDGNVDFSGANFGDSDVVFDGTNFGNGNIDFSYATCGMGHFAIKEGTFGNGKDKSDQKGAITFEHMDFGGRFSFHNCEETGNIQSLSFKGCAFQAGVTLAAELTCVPDLRGTIVTAHIDLDELRVNSKSRVIEDAPKYRRLKELAERNRHHEAALRFFADERRCMRWARGEKPWQTAWSYLASVLDVIYAGAGDYGRSIAWPVGWLGGLISGSTAALSRPPSCDASGSSMARIRRR